MLASIAASLTGSSRNPMIAASATAHENVAKSSVCPRPKWCLCNRASRTSAKSGASDRSIQCIPTTACIAALHVRRRSDLRLSIL